MFCFHQVSYQSLSFLYVCNSLRAKNCLQLANQLPDVGSEYVDEAGEASIFLGYEILVIQSGSGFSPLKQP